MAIHEIRQDTVILKSGRLIKIIMVDGVNFSLKSEEEQNIITFAYQNFLNSLDFPIQIIIHSRKININQYLAKLDARQREELSPLLQSQIGEYLEFIKSFVRENPVMSKTFLVAVPFVAANIQTPSASAFSKFLPFMKKKEGEAEQAVKQKEASFQENLTQLDQRVGQVAEGLHAIGLEVAVLTTDALIELFYNFYNPETVEKKELHLPKENNAQ